MKKLFILISLLPLALVHTSAQSVRWSSPMEEAKAAYNVKNYQKAIDICDHLLNDNLTDTAAFRIRLQSNTELYVNYNIEEYYNKALPDLNLKIREGSAKLLLHRARLYRARAKYLEWEDKQQSKKFFMLALDDLTAFEEQYNATELTKYIRQDINKFLAKLE